MSVPRYENYFVVEVGTGVGVGVAPPVVVVVVVPFGFRTIFFTTIRFFVVVVFAGGDIGDVLPSRLPLSDFFAGTTTLETAL